MTITHERLKQLLDYDHEIGLFRWKITQRNMKAGAIAGCYRSGPVRLIRVDGKYYSDSRLGHFYKTGEWPTTKELLRKVRLRRMPRRGKVEAQK
jgi:hypothetical protein